MQWLQELKSISQLSGKRGKRYDRTVLLGKATFDTVKVPVSKALIHTLLVMTNFFQWQILIKNLILRYLKKLLDECNNTYCHSIGKKTCWCWLLNPKSPKFEVVKESELLIPNSFSKGYTENWLREIFAIGSVLKTNPWTYKLKNLQLGSWLT